MFLILHDDVQHEMREIDMFMRIEEQTDEMNVIRDTIIVKAAMDSGAVKHVTHPTTLPSSVIIVPNCI